MAGYYPPAGGYPAPAGGYPAYPQPYPTGSVPPPGPGGMAYPQAGGMPMPPAGAAFGGDRPPREQCFFIKSSTQNVALEVQAASNAPGTRIVACPYNNQGPDHQLWFEDFATGSIKCRANLLCLDLQDGGPGFQLVKSPGRPPPGSVCLGRQNDQSGTQYSGVAHTQWGHIPGKAKGNDCWYPYGGKEHATKDFSWLVSSSVSLVRNAGRPPPGALAVGNQTDGGGVQYAGIARSRWGTIPGKAKGNDCWFSFGGKEHATSDFDWLVSGSSAVVGYFTQLNPNQLWMRSSDRIQNRQDQNKVLQLSDWAPGSSVSVGPPSGDSKQQWTFPSPSSAYPSAAWPQSQPQPTAPWPQPAPAPGPQPSMRRSFFIRSEMHGKVLDVEGQNRSPGAMVIMWPKKSPPAANQLWYQDDQGVVRSKLNDFAFEPSGHGIWLQPYKNKPNQMWTVQGKKIAMKSHPNKCLDIQGANKDDGAKLCQYQYQGNANQHWGLDYV